MLRASRLESAGRVRQPQPPCGALSLTTLFLAKVHLLSFLGMIAAVICHDPSQIKAGAPLMGVMTGVSLGDNGATAPSCYQGPVANIICSLLPALCW